MPDALVLVHDVVPGPAERYPGSTLPALRRHGFDVLVSSFAGGPSIPEPTDVDVIVVLGSAGSAYDDTLPWLAPERAYLQRAIDSRTPILGICFGAQVLSRVLGGTVARARRPEVGFVTLESADPAVLPSGTWMELHSDAFTLPPGATELAANDVGVQAFTHGPHLGVQFHPEITPEVFASWSDPWSPEMRAKVGHAALAQEIAQRADACALSCDDLVTRFLARAGVGGRKPVAGGRYT